ncbi:hypothetical protein [Chryseobacterium shigense]|uniref:Uncharacterized protein n=1 Tax=Chryseobacterium shigense TaxID=297244 RepID=A0A841N4V1_9FLAO|nr:hypothetical protein [Chryseobacterium shigense]MBB6371507.1 hypothetical protein [Chryseobacterium shigense]
MATNNTPTKTAFTVGGSLVGEGIINYKETDSIAPTNNTSQTLFRFVSLRNPQLTETKKQNLGFVQKPSELASAFDSVINPGDSALVKFQALERKAKEFNTTGYQSEVEIEEGPLSEALNIGRKIAKRETISTDDENTAKSLYNNSSIQSKVGQIWDNLIYQTVTQENFYVKEALVHILKALHFGYVADLPVTPELTKINGTDLKAKALDARVVLPMKLLGDGLEGEGQTPAASLRANMSQTGSGVTKETVLPSAVKQQLKVDGQKISDLSLLNFERDRLVQLRSELEKMQKLFYTIRAKAYDTANKQYLSANQEGIDAYNAMLEKINAQIDKEGLNQEEIDALYDALERLSVPEFKFEYKNELNFEDLKAKLSEDLFEVFIKNFALVNNGNDVEGELDLTKIEFVSDKEILIDKVPVTITEEYDTFIEVFEVLDELTSSKTQELFTNSPIQQQEYAKIGSVLVPVANKVTYVEISGTYYLKVMSVKALFTYSNAIIFYYNTDSDSLALSSAIMEISGDGQQNVSVPAIDIVDGKVVFPPTVNFMKSITRIKINLYFKNGEHTVVEHDIARNQEYTGKFSFKTMVDDGEGGENPGGENPGEGGENPGGTTNPQPGTFIPKHFGVKRLGIADYLKVVQSTHAYIPGEVTHIENVMAKEFKQKSTRRLRRSEIQTTTSKSTERETLSDTTTTTRNDMQSEVANVIQQDINTEAHFRYGGMGKSFEVGGSFAAHNSKENSTRQAMEKSQEITEKATERILTKVAEERIEKIIEEFEENNAHGFDNRNGNKHVVGVYRWVDKKMKNQIYNYGKRTMFEFMIPEPARLHNLATPAVKADTLKAPVDPRKADGEWKMPDFKTATKEQLQHWAEIYGVTLTSMPQANITEDQYHDDTSGASDWEMRNVAMSVPQNYKCTHYNVHYSYKEKRKKGKIKINNTGELTDHEGDRSFPANTTGTFTLTFYIYYIDIASFKVTKYCTLSDEFIESWKKENFDAIIKAYEEAYADFLVKQKELDDKAKEESEAANEKKDGLANFYRDMESVILKHNCIAYLLQNYIAPLGKAFTVGDKMSNFEVILGEELEQYTSLAKFMEQAFEWSIMDYTFYPYYWGERKRWQEMYLSQNTDPLFRSFLQAGMARVIVTVKPGFEDAVQFFMSTGKIWNGGEVPVIGDPMYLSIVDEMREPVGMKQGKPWITTLPTSLNILQEDSAGLKTLTALPFTKENPEEFEVPSDVVTETEFSIVDSQLNSGDDKFIDNIELNNGFLELTTDDNPKEIIASLPLSDLKQALQ